MKHLFKIKQPHEQIKFGTYFYDESIAVQDYWAYADADFLSTNEWKHVVCRFTKSNTIEIFINGSLVGRTNITRGDVAAKGSLSSTIGCYGGSSNHWKGSLDDVRFYNRAISNEEINTIYQE